MSFATEKYNEYDPEHPTRAILHPATVEGHEKFLGWTYEQYVSYYCSNHCTDIVEYDDYPFLASIPNTYEADFYENMEIIRHYALLHGRTYWFCLQSQYSGYHRDPDEGALRFSVYSAVAYGYSGITYYSYTSQSPETGLVGPDYVPNQKWHWAQTINAEVNALAPRLSRLESQKVYHTAPLPQGTTGITGSEKVAAVSGGDMVIGELTHEKTGVNYLFLTNSDENSGHTYTVTLSGSISQISKIDKGSGAYVPMTMNNNTITFAEGAGDGDLFAIDPDDSPPSVPQNLSSVIMSDTQIDLSWDASSDAETGINYYQVHRNGSEYARSDDTTYSDTHLPKNMSYTYEVSAVNWELVESGRSSSVGSAADFDRDNDVDQSDFGIFQSCYTGSGGDIEPGCEVADYDSDEDVDPSDFSVFQSCMAGANVPPGC